MNILICEDEEITMTALEFRLRKHGFKVVAVSNGKKALDAIEKGNIDLVVADVLMPHFTALELTKYVRRGLKSVLPIILISALGENDEEVLDTLQAGANDFIAKPFKPDELILRIKKVLQETNISQTLVEE